MGAVHSRTSRAAEFDVRELHGIAFRRALRKQDRRLERDAVALRRHRGGESGGARRRRERDERPRVNDGDDGIPIVAHEAARRFRRDTNEREEERWGDDRTETERRERRRAAKEMRALRLELSLIHI